jgi:hypothetical protein
MGSPGLLEAIPALERERFPDYGNERQAQEASIMKRTNIASVIVVVATLVATGALPGTAVAQKAAVPKPQDKLALGEPEVEQLLLLMDTDENGKISRQEWIKFMEAEFERLDKTKNGQLDVKALSTMTT